MGLVLAHCSPLTLWLEAAMEMVAAPATAAAPVTAARVMVAVETEVVCADEGL